MDLTGAIFVGANFITVNLTNTILTDANFENVVFDDTILDCIDHHICTD